MPTSFHVSSNSLFINHPTVWQYLGFTQWYCWGFKSSGMWRRDVAWGWSPIFEESLCLYLESEQSKKNFQRHTITTQERNHLVTAVHTVWPTYSVVKWTINKKHSPLPLNLSTDDKFVISSFATWYLLVAGPLNGTKTSRRHMLSRITRGFPLKTASASE